MYNILLLYYSGSTFRRYAPAFRQSYIAISF